MTGKIFRYVFFMGALALLLSALLFFGLQYAKSKNDLYAALKQEAVYIGNGVSISGKPYLDALDRETYVTWIAADGSVLYDNDSTSLSQNQGSYSEVSDTFETGEGYSIRTSESGVKTMYYAILLSDGSVLRLSRPYSAIETAFSTVSPVLWVIILILLLSGIIAFRAAKQITRPINELSLDAPETSGVYPELTPLVQKIREQNLTIREQMDELHARQNEFDSLTENMSEGFLLTDKNGVVLSANAVASRLIPEATVGLSLMEEGRSSVVGDALRAALSGVRSESRITDGSLIKQIIAGPAADGRKNSGAVLLILDVTESAKREELRREFSANVSHELKTPLTSISGFAELMMQELVPPEKMKEFANDIYRESKRLIALIEDIIKLSNLDEQETMPEEEPVDLYQLSKNVLESLSSTAEAKKISLELSGETVFVQGVFRFLDELVYNLADNAIKYNRENGSVSIEVTDTDHGAVLTVRDTGIGIPYEAQNRVFERFYRVGTGRSSEIPGTGLGLSIVKHAALIHEASIALKSEPGVGTEITVTFPKR